MTYCIILTHVTNIYRVMAEKFLDPAGGNSMSIACTYVKSLKRSVSRLNICNNMISDFLSGPTNSW